jgi:hypothetical protein
MIIYRYFAEHQLTPRPILYPSAGIFAGIQLFVPIEQEPSDFFPGVPMLAIAVILMALFQNRIERDIRRFSGSPIALFHSAVGPLMLLLLLVTAAIELARDLSR